MIETIDLTKTVLSHETPLHILDKVNLNIKAGESLAVVGASGSGKSTLLGLLAGLDVPTCGQVKINQVDITRLNEDERAILRGELVGFVFQSFQLLPGLTALENVMLPIELKGSRHARQAAATFLAKVGLTDRASHYPSQLSGGEQQRVAIARAFACQPQILFADEPTGNLDSHTGEQIIELLFALNRDSNTTLVLVTHEQRLAGRCERRICLDAGKVVSDSSIDGSVAAR